MLKKLLALSLFLTTYIIYSQNIKDVLPDFDKTGMETSILYNGTSISNILNYENAIHNTYSFYQVYKAIAFSDFEKRLDNLNSIKDLAKEQYSTRKVTLALLFSEFETLTNVAKNEIIQENGKIRRLGSNNEIFKKHELLIASPLKTKHKGLSTTFILPKSMVYNTTNNPIRKLEVDFDNKRGFINLKPDSNYTIDYSTVGLKTLQFKITFEDGTIKTSQATLEVNYSNKDYNNLFNRAITTFTSSSTALPNLTPYSEPNYKGIGEYDVYLSPDNLLDKPIFLVDGFDPADTRDIPSIYNLLNYFDGATNQNLGDKVRDEGYDVIVLNFPVYTRPEDSAVIDGGADFIERNAMLLVELIGIINAQKIGNEQNVVIGPSMGGLISRYALNFMENQGSDPDTRLWVSFDAPHLGANVPIGFQFLFNKMAYGLQLGGLGGDQSIVSLRPLVDDFLKSPAARQMLTDHFESHLVNPGDTDFDPNLKLPAKHPWSDLFFTALNGLTVSGFPETSRNVSMINGSGINARYPDNATTPSDILPNFPALNVIGLVIGSGVTAATGNFSVRFTPYTSQENTSGNIFIDTPFLCFCSDFVASAIVGAESFTDGIDAASGGLFDIGSLAGDFGGDPLFTSFFAGLKTDFFNFIPSVSSMAFEITNNEIDWFHTPSSILTAKTTTDTTPFDNWYMPDANEPHV